MPSPENTYRTYPLPRRELLKILVISAAGSLLTKDSRSVYAQSQSSEADLPTPWTREALLGEMAEFNIIFDEDLSTEDRALGKDIFYYANLNRALKIYKAAGIIDFSHQNNGPLHFYLNNNRQTLSGKVPFSSADAFYWNDGIPQISYFAKRGFDQEIPLDNETTLTQMHEIAHALQHRETPPMNQYNSSRVILTPPMVRFAEMTGYRILSSDDEITSRPPWTLEYEYTGSDPLLNSIDYRFDPGNPLVEGYAVTLSQYLCRMDLFKRRFPNHAAWVEPEIIRLAA